MVHCSFVHCWNRPLLAATQHRFAGLTTIGNIFFIFALVTYVTAIVAITTRFRNAAVFSLLLFDAPNGVSILSNVDTGLLVSHHETHLENQS